MKCQKLMDEIVRLNSIIKSLCEIIEVIEMKYFPREYTRLKDALCKLIKIEPLQIEVGKFYKNRKGEKCYVYNYSEYSQLFSYVIPGECEDHCNRIYSNGRYSDIVGDECTLDLISEWTEGNEK